MKTTTTKQQQKSSVVVRDGHLYRGAKMIRPEFGNREHLLAVKRDEALAESDLFSFASTLSFFRP